MCRLGLRLLRRGRRKMFIRHFFRWQQRICGGLMRTLSYECIHVWRQLVSGAIGINQQYILLRILLIDDFNAIKQTMHNKQVCVCYGKEN